MVVYGTSRAVSERKHAGSFVLNTFVLDSEHRNHKPILTRRCDNKQQKQTHDTRSNEQYIIGWSNNHYSNLHVRTLLETRLCF